MCNHKPKSNVTPQKKSQNTVRGGLTVKYMFSIADQAFEMVDEGTLNAHPKCGAD